MTTIRHMTDDDRAFVISAWSSSYRTSYHAGLLSMDTYADVMHMEIERIINQPDVITLVACEPGETDHLGRPFLYGFITYRQGHISYIYYVYVKSPYRDGKSKGMTQGYAGQLFDAAGIDPRKRFVYACRTGYCIKLASKIPHAEWNPLPARYPWQRDAVKLADKEIARESAAETK